MNKTFKKWAVIWKRDKNIIALYNMKETDICVGEVKETTGDGEILNPLMIFERKIDAVKWRAKNKDLEIVLVEIKILSN